MHALANDDKPLSISLSYTRKSRDEQTFQWILLMLATIHTRAATLWSPVHLPMKTTGIRLASESERDPVSSRYTCASPGLPIGLDV
jgi:hypothetical protein